MRIKDVKQPPIRIYCIAFYAATNKDQAFEPSTSEDQACEPATNRDQSFELSAYIRHQPIRINHMSLVSTSGTNEGLACEPGTNEG